MPNIPHRSDNEVSLAFRGFKECTLTVFHEERLAHLDLLLPCGLATDAILVERSDAAAEAARRFDERASALRRAEEERRKGGSQSNTAQEAYPAGGPLKQADAFQKPTERARLEKRYLEDQSALNGKRGYAQVYSWSEPLKLIQDAEVKSPDRESRERGQKLYQKLATLGSFRQLGAGVSDLDAMAAALNLLRTQQPHFAEVTDLILGRVRLAQVKSSPLHLPPILLAGPPGVGKTHFTLELAKAMARPVRRHSMDVSHTASSLTGSARNWSNTSTGLVFEMVCLGERADPLILLDELDKARKSNNTDPVAPLHSLLEPLTAKKVTDISLGIEFDASHIFWMATANDLNRIPEPIKSRFRVFNIALPTAEQSIALAQAVGASVLRRMNASANEHPGGEEDMHADTAESLFAPPNPRLYSLLAHLTPREQIQALEHAYATALINGRIKVIREDLPAEVLMADTDQHGESGSADQSRYLH